MDVTYTYLVTKLAYDIGKFNILKEVKKPLDNDITKLTQKLIQEPFLSARSELESADCAQTEQRRIEHIENARKNFLKAMHVETDIVMSLKSRFYVAVCFDAMGECNQADRWYGDVIKYTLKAHEKILFENYQISKNSSSGEIFAEDVLSEMERDIKSELDSLEKKIGINIHHEIKDTLGFLGGITVGVPFWMIGKPKDIIYKNYKQKPFLYNTEKNLVNMYKIVDELMPIIEKRNCGIDLDTEIYIKKITNSVYNERNWDIGSLVKDTLNKI